MKNNKQYILEEKEFKLLQKLAGNIYNITVVIENFCSSQQEIEELSNLLPIIKNLCNDADNLYYYFVTDR